MCVNDIMHLVVRLKAMSTFHNVWYFIGQKINQVLKLIISRK